MRGEGDGREVLAQGSSEPPRRLRRALLLAAVAALVVTGYLARSGQDAREPDPPAAGPTAPAVPTPSSVATRTPARSAPAAAPAPGELAGMWLVDRGPSVSWPRGMWLKFLLDGRFTVDPGPALMTGTPWAQGRYRLDDDNLTLLVRGGRACRPGDSLIWQVGLSPNGRLVTEHLTDNHGHCRVTHGAVWSARPLVDRDVGRVEGIG